MASICAFARRTSAVVSACQSSSQGKHARIGTVSKLLSCTSCLALLVFPHHAGAQGETVIPNALICHFTQALTSTYKGGQFVDETRRDKFEITYASIEPENGQAQMIGNMGAAPASATNTGRLLLFIERTPAGNFDLTSVIIGPLVGGFSDRMLPAAHSRHIRMLDDFLISQYTGFCEPRY